MSLMTILEALPVEPHPALVAVQQPTPREVAEVAALLGWLPDPEDRFRPALIEHGGV